jgi:hypothetical protein
MKEIEASVSFGEYIRERGSMQGITKEDALMTMFKKRGIQMDGDVNMKPREPVTIITDPVNKVFVVRQVQFADN